MENIQKYVDLYVAMWKNIPNFKDRTNRMGYWVPVLINVVIAFIISALGIEALSSVFSCAVSIAGIGLTVRRLNDIGKNWKWIFISLIPVIGWIWQIVLLVRESAPDDGRPVV